MKFAKAVKGECLICQTKIPKTYDSHSPEPILPDEVGRCCTDCYITWIVPIRQLRGKYAVSARAC